MSELTGWMKRNSIEVKARDAKHKAELELLGTARMVAIRNRLAAATPGEWRACKDGECICGIVWAVDSDMPLVAPPADEELADRVPRGDAIKSNARFIAYAKADIEWLLAEVERLKRGDA